MVHPQLRTMAAVMLAQPFPLLTAATVQDFRFAMTRWRQPPLPGVSFDKRSIKGIAGGPDVTVFVVNARAGANRPGILRTHGGGFVAGAAELDLPNLQALALKLDCVIVTVEYRLAPEVRWNGSCEDNYVGLLWPQAQAEQLGIDRSRIAVMGESAGGGHAALLALNARSRRGAVGISMPDLPDAG